MRGVGDRGRVQKSLSRTDPQIVTMVQLKLKKTTHHSGDDQAVVSTAVLPTKGDPRSNKTPQRTPTMLVPSKTTETTAVMFRALARLVHNCKEN